MSKPKRLDKERQSLSMLDAAINGPPDLGGLQRAIEFTVALVPPYTPPQLASAKELFTRAKESFEHVGNALQRVVEQRPLNVSKQEHMRRIQANLRAAGKEVHVSAADSLPPTMMGFAGDCGWCGKTNPNQKKCSR
jgi:hypothetical protein